MTVEHARAAFQRWHTALERGLDLMGAIVSIASPDCLVHAQNGEVGPLPIMAPQMKQMRLAFPDLEAEIEHMMFTDDRLVTQLILEGTPALTFGLSAPGARLRSSGAMVARVNDRSEMVEVWPYSNPGAAFTFPRRTTASTPPDVTAAPGNEAGARALCATWMRAITGPELIERILETAAVDCLVHATNGEVGRTDLAEEQLNTVGSAFPDVTVAFEDTVFEGERFFAQLLLSGTHRGQLGILPPSGRRVESTAAIAGRVNDSGRAMELWLYLAPGMGLLFPRGDRPRE